MPDEEEICPLDADGAHQPVRVTEWVDQPGPIADGGKEFDRRMCQFTAWTKKLFCELFAYLEPSLFGGAIQPTDSITVLKQLMERCFGYNTGIVAGQQATKLKHHKISKEKQFEIFRKDYIANGRPLRTIKFENQVVHWENTWYKTIYKPAAESCNQQG